MIYSQDHIKQQAYLISRGVRPLALLETIPTDDMVDVLRVYNELEKACYTGLANGNNVIAMVYQRKDSSQADVGFASKAWVIETFKWIMENTPQPHLNRLLGLLLGYSPDAIAALDESECGNLFPDPVSTSDESTST